ncbi:vacuolar protein sorting-associated protein 11 homolog [Aspergillus lentulus]|uniref:Vacuolar protein sorting-associated protein 11 homolog n=1 Tax=Aspergillus lentulus TaxID=293939 RepID=A0AAN4PEK3_ASPLE|nr:hypothetical protein CNMCM8060_008432 [Aspergillus lentulus]KAF4193237.1 hypothetical protein CNMCM8694_009087 [Aspergillus lentulus]GAQ03110.1 vacuolar protein sorting-associated protein 11 homolog [Aspergillus lentulus]
MALTSWKAFNFFDVSSVKLPEDCSSILKSGLTSLSAGSSNLFVASTDGVVHTVSAGFKIVRSFKAADNGSITHMKQIEGTSLLITIAEDLPNEPVLKVWALDKPEKKTGVPRCLSTTSIQNARRPFPISSFAALEDLSQVAVGFGNGSVTIIRGDLIHDRGARQRIVFESEEPITGLEVQSGALSTLFISTTSRILTLVISGRGQGQPARVLDDSGCGVGCMALDKDTGDIVVAREDAIYTYGPHGRGPSYAFDSPKNSINVFRDYVALVCPPRASLGNLRSQADEIFSTATFTLLDTDLKFIAHSESLAGSVKHVFIEWGDLFLLSTDGKVYRYREKSLQQKLEILYQRNLYILAINLAQKKGIDALQQNAIYRKYGDFLYQKGDYDTAMQQYLRAIDNTEPSQVIRKYLDTQRIHNLIEYLEELHDHDRATVDHTTLLLNCYAKLKDTDKLNSFIKAPGELKFDLETAIAMCRQGGYYEQAAYLATKYGENDMVIDILIEDSKKYAEAVEYIWRLEPDLAYHNLMKYARVLLANCPQETTELFMAYYKGQYRPRTEVEVPAAPQTQPTSTLQSLAGFLPLSLINAGSGTKAEKPKVILDEETKIEEPTPSYEIPRPRTAFSAFVGRPQEFIAFLESLIDLETLKEEDKVDIYTTLFEMYLDTANRKKGSAEKEEWENKAKTLIEGKDIPISTSNVLLLSDLSNFREGSTLVREQEGLRSDIFRSFTSAKDTHGAIRALRKYGPEEPQLYVDALTYFASSPAILEEAGDELDVVLKRIHDDGLMSPLQVIQALSNNSVVTMGRVKKYLSDNIERERKEISTNRRLVSSYSSETEKKRQEIEQLGTKPVVFQARRCNACGGALDLPTVHFLCKHSFHQRCLNKVDEDAECPMCAQEISTIKAIRRRQVESADQHDLFKGELQRAKDRFGVVTYDDFETDSPIAVDTNACCFDALMPAVELPHIDILSTRGRASFRSPIPPTLTRLSDILYLYKRYIHFFHKMSFDRVIQDSDDEDDPLSEMPPLVKRAPEQPKDHVDNETTCNEQSGIVTPGGEAQDIDHGNYLAVDFDAFLQSQETAPNGFSASQQRREEKWIPSDAGAGSIVMTEIGLAQQRLFDDDDAQHAVIREARTALSGDQPDNGSALAQSLVPLDMVVSNYDENNHHEESPGALQPGAFVAPTSQDMALLNGKTHGHGYSNNDITGFYGDHIRHVGPQNGSSTHDLAQSSTSYNFFESSLNPPAQLNDDIQSYSRSSDTVQTEAIHKTPGRSHSMQATSYSPHDTEPISSLVTPKVSRVQSDSTCRYVPSHSPGSAYDELAAPVTIEIPAVKKKRGRKRKQDIPEDDEDDELAPSNDQSIPESAEPVKRKPGRPPKVVRTVNEFDDAGLANDQPQDRPVPGLEEIQELGDNPLPLNEIASNPIANGVSHALEKNDLRVEVANDSKENRTEVSNDPSADMDIQPAKPLKKAKESKKKKLKRGKTTSVTLRKTYESDVEDDVIWIDERPSNHILQDEQTAQKLSNDPTSVDSKNTESFQIHIPGPLPPSASEGTEPKTSLETWKDEPKPALPTPKKRGRKRKKTSELQTSEETPAENVKGLTRSGHDNQEPPTRQSDIRVSVMLERPSNQDTHEQKTETMNDNSTSGEEATTHPESLSPSDPSPATETNAPETPKKSESSSNQADLSICPKTKDPGKGPDRHSPIAGTSKVPYRVGLSRKARIAPLLKIVRR